jgi:hypothetical protein
MAGYREQISANWNVYPEPADSWPWQVIESKYLQTGMLYPESADTWLRQLVEKMST